MANTTSILAAPLGGMAIGAALTAVTALTGRSVGISGMAASLLTGRERLIPVIFLAAMIGCGALLGLVSTGFAADASGRPDLAFVLGGLLVGFGAREANGCTSGHGILGVSRTSVRSIVAIALFCLAASLVVAVWPGGVS